MVNLLFISNNTKIDKIISTLQPSLKVKIDVVADFDLGLKDVFEKRPATVFIQDQIAGVSGESVARHIQMLLGNGAPNFVFMFEGSTKAKPIKGLFEYLIDVLQDDVKVVEDIQVALKSFLGSQWDKIYTPPTVALPVVDPLSVTDREWAIPDQLHDDFLSDLDTLNAEPGNNISLSHGASTESVKSADNSFQIVSSPHDQLTQVIVESNKELVVSKISTIPVNTAPTLNESVPEKKTVPPLQNLQSTSDPVKNIKENVESQTVSPADFVIVAERADDNIAPEDLLRMFEGGASITGRWKRYIPVVLLLVICAGVVMLFSLKSSNNHKLLNPKSSADSVVAPSTVNSADVVKAVNAKPVTPPEQKSVKLPLPSFIPQSGVDNSFPSQKPGWERYVDTNFEFRLYRSAEKIKALQVLAVKNHEISEPKMKSILIELLGDGEYVVKSRGLKHGLHVTYAAVGQRADLLIYRKNKMIQAFVVSLD